MNSDHVTSLDPKSQQQQQQQLPMRRHSTTSDYIKKTLSQWDNGTNNDCSTNNVRPTNLRTRSQSALPTCFMRRPQFPRPEHALSSSALYGAKSLDNNNDDDNNNKALSTIMPSSITEYESDPQANKFHFDFSDFAAVQRVLDSIRKSYRCDDNQIYNSSPPQVGDFDPTPIKPGAVEIVQNVTWKENSWNKEKGSLASVLNTVRATMNPKCCNNGNNNNNNNNNNTVKETDTTTNNNGDMDELLQSNLVDSNINKNFDFETTCQRLAEEGTLSAYSSTSDLSKWSGNKEDEDMDAIFTRESAAFSCGINLNDQPLTHTVKTSHHNTNDIVKTCHNGGAVAAHIAGANSDNSKKMPQATNDDNKTREDPTQNQTQSEDATTTTTTSPLDMSSSCQSQLSWQWYRRYNELVEFKKVHGHCVVPHNWPKNRPLGQWVKRQRYQRKLKVEGQHSTLTQDREDALSKLGFVWDSHVSGWEERFEELRQYRDDHGHCHVPTTYPENPQLAVWVKCQRRQFKRYMTGRKSTMNKDRVAKLVGLGFIWNPRGLKV